MVNDNLHQAFPEFAGPQDLFNAAWQGRNFLKFSFFIATDNDGGTTPSQDWHNGQQNKPWGELGEVAFLSVWTKEKDRLFLPVIGRRSESIRGAFFEAVENLVYLHSHGTHRQVDMKGCTVSAVEHPEHVTKHPPNRRQQPVKTPPKERT